MSHLDNVSRNAGVIFAGNPCDPDNADDIEWAVRSAVALELEVLRQCREAFSTTSKPLDDGA